MSAKVKFFGHGVLFSNGTLVTNGESEWWFYSQKIKKKEISVLWNLT